MSPPDIKKNHKIIVVQYQRSYFLSIGPSDAGALVPGQLSSANTMVCKLRPCLWSCSRTLGFSASRSWEKQRESVYLLHKNSWPGDLFVLFLLTSYFLTHGMLCHRGLGNAASSWAVLGVITHTLRVWKSENIWRTAAISSILGVTLFGKIVSIYWWTNQDLEMSNNVTQFNKWHNQNSYTGIVSDYKLHLCNQWLMLALIPRQFLSNSFLPDGPPRDQPPPKPWSIVSAHLILRGSLESAPCCSPFLPSALPDSQVPCAVPRPCDAAIF